MKNKQNYINLLTNIVAFVIQFVISFYVTKTVIATSGSTSYGFLSMANDFITYLSVIVSVLNSVVSRFIALSISKGDTHKANQYFSSTLIANIVLSVAFCVIGYFFIGDIDGFINIDPSLVADVQITFAITLATYVVTILSSLFTVGTYVTNRLDINAYRNIVQYTLRLACIVVCFTCIGSNIYYVSISSLVASVVIAIANIGLNHRLVPELRISVNLFSFRHLREIVASGVWISLSNLSTIFIRYFDLIIANLFINAYAMGLLSSARTMPNYATTLITTLGALFTPSLVIAYASGERQSVITQTVDSMKVMTFSLFTPLVGFMIFADNFYALWLDTLTNQEITTVSIVSTITMVQALFNAITQPVAQLSIVTNKVRVPVVASLVCGFGNLLLIYLLLRFTGLGIFAISVSSTVIMLVRYILFNCMYGERIIAAPAGTFSKYVAKFTPLILILAIPFAGIKCLVSPHTWISFILCCCVCGLAGYLISALYVYGYRTIAAYASKLIPRR